MKSKPLWIALAAAPVIAAFAAAPNASVAATKHHVTCSIVHHGKTETKKVATAKECTDMGGHVVSPKDTKKY